MKKEKSLKKTLLLNILFFVFIPIITISVINLLISVKSLKKEILSKNITLTKALSLQVNEYLYMASEDLKNINAFLLQSEKLSLNTKLLFFQNVITHKHFFKPLNIQVLDKNGISTLVFPYKQEFIGIDFSSQTFFKEVKFKKKVYFSRSYISPQLNIPIITLSMPHKDGVLAISFELSILTSLVKELKTDKNNFIAIIDQTGTVIAHTERENVLKREWLSHNELIKNIKTIKNYNVKYKNENYLLIASPIKKVNWKILLYQSSKQINKPITNLSIVLISALLIMFIFSIVIDFIQFKKFSIQLDILIYIANKISTANYKIKIPSGTYIEFKNVFNSLINLARKVQDREKDLIKSEEKFRQIADNINDIFWLGSYTDKLKFLYINNAFEQITGISPQQVYKNSDFWFKCIYTDDKNQVINNLNSFINNKSEYNDVFRIIKKDGSIGWISSKGTIVSISQTGEVRIAGIAQDITENVNATDTLNTLFVSLAQITGHECFNKITLELCRWFSADCAIVGEITNESRVKAISMYYNNEYINDYKYDLKNTPCANTIKNEGCIITDNVTEAFPHDPFLKDMQAKGYAGFPIVNKDRKIIGIISVISKRKLLKTEMWKEMLKVLSARASAEIQQIKIFNELRQTKSYLDNVIDSMPSILIGIDKNIKITNMNKEAEFISKSSSSATLTKDLVEVFPLFKNYLDELKTIIEKKQFFSKERVVDQSSGELHYKNISAYPLISDDYKGAVIRIDDITELEKKEMQLRHAHKMESIGNLAGGLAHDFNNLLGGIIGSMSLLKRVLGREKLINNERIEMCLETIKTASDRASDMVKQLLTLSRKHEFEVVPVDLNLSVKHVMKICNNSFPKIIELSPEYSKEEIIIAGDPTQVEQVILNVCINASHAMTIMREQNEQQGGVLTISFETLTADRHFCNAHIDAVESLKYHILQINDTGVGMTAEIRAKAFEPFFTTKQKEKGTGLGLSMVYSIIKQHNGFVDIYSKPGIGTSFTIYFPEYNKDLQIQTIKKKDEEVLTGEGLVLVVDDEQVMRETALGILEECGYQVLIAKSGKDGIDLYQKNKEEIVLVLLDMAMPQMSGKEVFVKLKKINPEIKVLIASGYKQDYRVKDTLDLGANNFIQKPYNLESLAKAVYNILYT